MTSPGAVIACACSEAFLEPSVATIWFRVELPPKRRA
jgi:hypothetical protein